MAEYIKISKDTFPTPYESAINDFMKGWNACLNSVLQHKITYANQKIYLIEWHCNWSLSHSDIIKAKDKAQAWTKLRWRHFFDRPRRIIKIIELKE